MAFPFSPRLFINFVSFINTVIEIFNPIKEISLDLFMMLGPATNYVFQAIKFYRTKSSKGFSNFLCLVTILAHTTKIYFWFGKRYVYTLLVQSILVILILLYIIYLCLKYREISEERSSSISLLSEKKISIPNKIKKFFGQLFGCSKTLNPKLIWRWNKVIEYYKFYFLIIAVLTLLLFACGIENKIYANILGYINLVLELLCSLPQIIELYRTKNQRNISKMMVLLWFAGNILKIYYNYYNNSPLQLILGAYIQVFFNIILIGQLIYYYIKNQKENKIINDVLNDSEKNEKEINSNDSNDDNEDVNIIVYDDKPNVEKEEKSINIIDNKIKDDDYNEI